MRPVHTADSDTLFTGEGGVMDLPTQTLADGSHASVWWLTYDERLAVVGGANIALIVAAKGHPPVMLAVVDTKGVGEDAPIKLTRLEQLRDEADLEARVKAMAVALHVDCIDEWQALADPERQVTMHGLDAHDERARQLIRRLAGEAPE